MAYQIVWTKRALAGYDRIVNHLIPNWSEKELRSFIVEVDSFFEVLKEHPEILQKTFRHTDIYRGPINKLTIITCRIKPRQSKSN
jgi:plasmid stabilization system protein ParE